MPSSIVSIVAFSSLSAKFISSGRLSSSPRFLRAPVQAKRVATEFVEVSSKKELIDEYLSVEKIEKSKYFQEYRKIYKYYKENVDYLSLKKDGIRSIDRSDAVPIDVYNQNESAIEKALEVLKSDTYSRDDKLKANEEILGFTVSVPKFRIDDYEIKKLKMPYTELPVINSSYDSECVM